MAKTFQSFFAELLIRFYIVSKFNLSKTRFIIYYFIFFRIMVKKLNHEKINYNSWKRGNLSFRLSKLIKNSLLISTEEFINNKYDLKT